MVRIACAEGAERPQIDWFLTAAHDGKGLEAATREAASEIGFCLMGEPSMVSYVEAPLARRAAS